MRAPRVAVLLATVIVAITSGGAAGASSVAGWTSHVSVGAGYGQPNTYPDQPAVSAGGRYVAFTSGASNLVPGDTNGAFDVFVRDTRMLTTSRVSLTADGGQVDGMSYSQDISADGRYVVFTSKGTNILPGDPNPVGNVYLRDRVAGTTVRATPPASRAGWPAISADGRYVAYATAQPLVPGDTNQREDVYVWARETGALERVSVSTTGGYPDRGSHSPSLSNDGRLVAFYSEATNLVPRHGYHPGVFVRDRMAGTTTRVSVASDGTPADDESWRGEISGDGRYVVFTSLASNLHTYDIAYHDVFVHDRFTGTTELANLDSNSAPLAPGGTDGVISGDGRYIAFVTTTGAVTGVMRRDRLTGETITASVSTAGVAANGGSYWPTISDDGQTIAFLSAATNLAPRGTRGGSEIFLRHYWR
jgi:TolB protein